MTIKIADTALVHGIEIPEVSAELGRISAEKYF
jgi:hypothetical protein